MTSKIGSKEGSTSKMLSEYSTISSFRSKVGAEGGGRHETR